jgi:hypothetical protein
LQGGFLLGIGIGLAAVTSHAPSQRTVEGFQMIGVNILVSDILGGVRVFWLWGLIFGALRPWFVALTAFVLEPNLDPGL